MAIPAETFSTSKEMTRDFTSASQARSLPSAAGLRRGTDADFLRAVTIV